MYGSPASRKANAESGSAAGHAPTSPTTATATTSDSKDHGISRQILNPGGDKHDEVRFGAPASADTQASQLPTAREDALESRMGEPKEDRSVKRQIL